LKSTGFTGFADILHVWSDLPQTNFTFFNRDTVFVLSSTEALLPATSQNTKTHKQYVQYVKNIQKYTKTQAFAVNRYSQRLTLPIHQFIPSF